MAGVPGTQGQNIYPEPGQQAKRSYTRGNDSPFCSPLATTAPPPSISISDVMTQVGALELTLSAFADELQTLEDKVGPVLRPYLPDDVNPGAGDPALTPLALRLRDSSRRLADHLDRLRDIRQRIDL